MAVPEKNYIFVRAGSHLCLQLPETHKDERTSAFAKYLPALCFHRLGEGNKCLQYKWETGHQFPSLTLHRR